MSNWFASIKVSSKQILETGMVFAIICIVAGLRTEVHIYYFGAISLLLLTLLVPVLIKPLALIWFGISKILGWFSTRLLLGAIFYFLVTPVGWVRRLLKKDGLQLNNFKKGTVTAFIKRNHKFLVKDLEAVY